MLSTQEFQRGTASFTFNSCSYLAHASDSHLPGRRFLALYSASPRAASAQCIITLKKKRKHLFPESSGCCNTREHFNLYHLLGFSSQHASSSKRALECSRKVKKAQETHLGDLPLTSSINAGSPQVTPAAASLLWNISATFLRLDCCVNFHPNERKGKICQADRGSSLASISSSERSNFPVSLLLQSKNQLVPCS